MMVLIFSNDDDLTTNTVIDWILYYGGNFIRINQDDIIVLESLTLTNDQILTCYGSSAGDSCLDRPRLN